MIFSQDRETLRRMYRDAWLKLSEGQPLSPLEAQIAAVVQQHPEYHALIESADAGGEFTPDQGRTNPYLHMGLHLAIREQVGTDRPAGIADVFRALSRRRGDPLEAEHDMMEALAETLWEAQRNGAAPDEHAYLERLRRLQRG